MNSLIKLIIRTVSILSFVGHLGAQVEKAEGTEKVVESKPEVAAKEGAALEAGKLYLNLSEKAFWKYAVEVSAPTTHPLTHTSSKPVLKDGRLHYSFAEERRYMGFKAVSGMKDPAHAIYIYLQPEKMLREVQYLKIGTEGLFALGASTVKADGTSSHLILSSPMPLIFEKAKLGVQWGWETKVGPQLTEKVVFDFRVVGEEKVTTKAGEFATRRVQVVEKIGERQLGKRDYWFADGVGIIKEVDERYLVKGMMIRSKTELLSYDLNPPTDGKAEGDVESKE